MTAKPLDWFSWWNARLRMSEIWKAWAHDYDAANQAMIRALRSGEVHYRGSAVKSDGFTPVPFEDVIATMQELFFLGPDEVTAQYEITATNFHVSDFGRELGFSSVIRPLTSKSRQTARIWNPELAWTEFRDYLIRCELPAGATPDDAAAARSQRRGPSRGEARSQQKRPPNRRRNLGTQQRQHGPRPGVTGFTTADKALFPTIDQMIEKGEARSGIAAARILDENGRVASGGGTPESRAARLARRYGKWKSTSKSVED